LNKPIKYKGRSSFSIRISSNFTKRPSFHQPGLTPPASMSGRSFVDVLVSGKSGRVDPKRNRVFSARERHSSSRYNNLAYPIRALRTHDFLYIRNFRPERWPAGHPAG